MTHIKWFIDFVLHINVHLEALVQNYGVWVYAILFLIVFCETGLVVTPILPGDSLLFAVGAICATSPLRLDLCLALLAVAAILGDATNYWIGYWAGPRVFAKGQSRLLNPKHLQKAQLFYEKHGGKAVFLARFVPIVRTFVPFVAGIGKMSYRRFTFYNVTGAAAWILPFTLAGFFFGNVPAVKRNFSYIVFAIIILSVLPIVIAYIQDRKAKPPNGHPQAQP